MNAQNRLNFLIHFGSLHSFCLKYSLQVCDECGEDFCLYNTNVMYDRYGRYVAKYHKYNLFNSEFSLFNIDKNEQNIYVDTDFGKLSLHVELQLLNKLNHYYQNITY